MSEQVFDIAVLGAGPGGYVAAMRAADLGASVALIECGYSGGTCLNVGCIPTKAMLHASELFHEVATAGPTLGIHADGLRFDLAEQIATKDKTVARLRAGLDKVISQRANITRFHAYSRLAATRSPAGALGSALQEFRIVLFDPANRASTTGQIAARSVIIATGSRPVRPRAFAFDGTHIITTDEVLSLRSQPRRLLVLGGGVNGCEQATFFAEIGTAVTVVEALDRILPTLDEDVSREVVKSLKKRKVTIHAGRKAASIERISPSPSQAEGRGEGDIVRTTLDDGTVIETDVALIAIGRAANIDDIGIETIGLSPSPARFISVDDRCRTAVPGVYAIGDVTGVAPYAHVAFRQGEVAAANAVAECDERDDMTVIPAGIFTHPEIGTVGVSERQSAYRGLNVKVVRFPLQALGIAQAQQLASGWVKLIVEADTGLLLGAAAVCPRAAEVVHELALAIRHGMTVTDIVHTIHAHPTYSEAVKEAADHYLGLPIHGLKT